MTTTRIERLQNPVEIPHIIKYMGSKKNLLDFVIDGISDTYSGGPVCDLFAGTAILAGALRNQVPMVSNDIQAYSSVLANLYLSNFEWGRYPYILDEIVEKTTNKVAEFTNLYPQFHFEYFDMISLEQFNTLEEKQQNLIEEDFSKSSYHLFVKNYSGTYWSYDQCVWIDALRAVADDYKGSPIFYAVIASLMFAMAYNSQSTGHYAQYRDATNEKSMADILSYRQKSILPYFERKFQELQIQLGRTTHNHKIFTMDYRDCLDQLEPNTTVYADPPYCFVHYSRFYHALETLVKYDYPDVRYKGRYRTDRHQSPFCISTQVSGAFEEMFLKVREKRANLVLSYSDTGMIELDRLMQLANEVLRQNYRLEVMQQDYLHSTMGRREDKSRDVQEVLLLAKRR